MSDLENIDDELLSAYLDDELSPAERARVEERLAIDPAARQLLEQLRAMSQAVHGLPQESLGREFRDAIVRRAQQASAERTSHIAKIAAAASTSSAAPSNGTVTELRPAGPSFTLGRTRRGWVWAAMAVAAGLLIVVFQPAGEQNQNPREVALRQLRENGEEAKVAADAPKQRATTAQPAPSSPAAATAPAPMTDIDLRAESGRLNDGSASSVGGNPTSAPGLGRELADKSTQPSREPTGSTELGMPTESDRFAATNGRPATLGFGTDAAAPAGSLAGEGPLNAPQMAADDGQFVIVRVLAKPEALQNKTFDKILGTNGVEVIELPADGVEQLASQKERLTAIRQQTADQEKAAESSDTDTDVILVEAPTQTIFSCLSSLNQDVQNFPGISVDESTPAEEQKLKPKAIPTDEITAEAEAAPAKALPKLPSAGQKRGLDQYSRGYVPPQDQVLTRGGGLNFEARGSIVADRASGNAAGGFGGGIGGQTDDAKRFSEMERSLRKDKDSSGANWARARRVLPDEMSGIQNRGRAESNLRGGNAGGESSSIAALKLESSPADAKADATENADQLQVLFIFSAGEDATQAAEPATSPPATDRAK